jgi:mannose-6-phosphate isomerase-like protein (cupin superfamily)
MSVDSTTTPQAHFFDLEAPLLAQGRFDQVVAATDLLKLRIKVYASGGENALHMHPREDHAFVVLQGEATFFIGSEEAVRVVGKYQGVMLPRGTLYRFECSSEENLVMLRTGAAEEWPENARAFSDGRPFPGSSVENHQVEMIPIPGQFFGP